MKKIGFYIVVFHDHWLQKVKEALSLFSLTSNMHCWILPNDVYDRSRVISKSDWHNLFNFITLEWKRLVFISLFSMITDCKKWKKLYRCFPWPLICIVESYPTMFMIGQGSSRSQTDITFLISWPYSEKDWFLYRCFPWPLAEKSERSSIVVLLDL